MLSLDLEARDPIQGPAVSLEEGLATAKQYAVQDRLDDALRLWLDLCRRFPDQRHPYADAAAQLRQSGRSAEAEVWLEAALKRFPNDLGFAIERAWLAYHRRDLTEAARRWLDVMTRYPDHPAGGVGLAVSLRDAGRLEEADAVLAGARQKFPGDVSTFAEYAWLAYRRRDWQEAIARWQDFRSRFPDHIAGYTAGATSLREAGRGAEAEALLGEAAGRFPNDAGTAVELAHLAHHQRNWAVAIARWQTVRERFPDRRDGYLNGARSLQSAGDFKASARLMQEADQRWPGDREVLIASAHMAFDRTDTDECIRLGRALMRLFPDDPAGVFHLVRALRDSGRAQEAEDVLVNAPEAFPGDSPILSIWASLAMTRSDWPEAARRWQMLRERFPGDAKFSWQYASALRRLNQDREASAVLDEACNRFPDDTMIQSMWIESPIRAGNWDLAAERAALVRQRLPDLAVGYTLGAKSLRQLGQDERAEKLLIEARQRLPQDVHVRRAEAEDATARRDWAAAERLWSEFRAVQPNDVGGYLGGASSLREAGRLELADTLLREAIDRFPLSVAAHSMWATIAQQREQHDEAAQRWALLRQRFPENEAGYVGGARSLREAGRPAEANALMQQAAERFPGDPDVAIQHARFAASQGDHTAAAARFQAAAERFPFRSELPIGLAESLTEMGRHAEADAALAQALERFPEDPAVFIAYGLNAVRRLDWNEALRRWTEMSKRFPQEKSLPTRIFEVQLRLAETEGASKPAAATSAAQPAAIPQTPAPSHDMAEVVKHFESLGGSGHGCEFGLFQRHFGAEPLGLLRWADLAHELLTRALETRFDGVGEPEHTELFAPPGDRAEWWTRDRRFWMAMRSFIRADQIPYDKMFTQACRRIQFLRRKLIEDLQAGEKIFVFKCLRHTLTEAELTRLHAAVRQYGRNTFLYVRYEDPENPNGTVRVRGNGLMVGYVDRFAFSPKEENLGPATDSWAGVCRAAYDLWVSGKTE